MSTPEGKFSFALKPYFDQMPSCSLLVFSFLDYQKPHEQKAQYCTVCEPLLQLLHMRQELIFVKDQEFTIHEYYAFKPKPAFFHAQRSVFDS